MVNSEESFQSGWYQIVDEDGSVIADPKAINAPDALNDFVQDAQQQWPGSGRVLQFSLGEDGPWSAVTS